VPDHSFPAYPQHGASFGQPGMSERKVYALAAMQAMISSWQGYASDTRFDAELVQRAFQIADAMLAESVK
jgi:hypothetical protein